MGAGGAIIGLMVSGENQTRRFIPPAAFTLLPPPLYLDGSGGWKASELAQAPNRRILSIGMGYDETVYALTAGGPILRLEGGSGPVR